MIIYIIRDGGGKGNKNSPGKGNNFWQWRNKEGVKNVKRAKEGAHMKKTLPAALLALALLGGCAGPAGEPPLEGDTGDRKSVV